MKHKSDKGRLFLKVRGNKAFLISGMPTVSLKLVEIIPLDMQQLILLIEGKRMSKHSLTNNVLWIKKKQDLDGDFIIAYQNFSSEKKLKKLNFRLV